MTFLMTVTKSVMFINNRQKHHFVAVKCDIVVFTKAKANISVRSEMFVINCQKQH